MDQVKGRSYELESTGIKILAAHLSFFLISNSIKDLVAKFMK